MKIMFRIFNKDGDCVEEFAPSPIELSISNALATNLGNTWQYNSYGELAYTGKRFEDKSKTLFYCFKR